MRNIGFCAVGPSHPPRLLANLAKHGHISYPAFADIVYDDSESNGASDGASDDATGGVPSSAGTTCNRAIDRANDGATYGTLGDSSSTSDSKSCAPVGDEGLSGRKCDREDGSQSGGSDDSGQSDSSDDGFWEDLR